MRWKTGNRPYVAGIVQEETSHILYIDRIYSLLVIDFLLMINRETGNELELYGIFCVPCNAKVLLSNIASFWYIKYIRTFMNDHTAYILSTIISISYIFRCSTNSTSTYLVKWWAGRNMNSWAKYNAIFRLCFTFSVQILPKLTAFHHCYSLI